MANINNPPRLTRASSKRVAQAMSIEEHIAKLSKSSSSLPKTTGYLDQRRRFIKASETSLYDSLSGELFENASITERMVNGEMQLAPNMHFAVWGSDLKGKMSKEDFARIPTISPPSNPPDMPEERKIKGKAFMEKLRAQADGLQKASATNKVVHSVDPQLRRFIQATETSIYDEVTGELFENASLTKRMVNGKMKLAPNGRFLVLAEDANISEEDAARLPPLSQSSLLLDMPEERKRKGKAFIEKRRAEAKSHKLASTVKRPRFTMASETSIYDEVNGEIFEKASLTRRMVNGKLRLVANWRAVISLEDADISEEELARLPLESLSKLAHLDTPEERKVKGRTFIAKRRAQAENSNKQ